MSNRSLARIDRLALWWLYALLFILPAAGLYLLGTVIDPVPRIHDEHAHLIAGHTFSNGTLGNPSHPLAEHFAAINVLAEPSYASKFPPGQGLVIALGLKVFNSAHAGIALSAGAFICALFFALSRLLSRRWALWGCALACVQYVAVGYWGTTFWGGYVAATGGALVAGVGLDMITKRRVLPGMTALLLAGLGLLSVSRPMYGVILATPTVLLWLYHATQQIKTRRTTTLCSLLVFAIGAVAIFGFAAVYNHSITGRASVFPHALYQQIYGHPVVFMWSEKGPDKNAGSNGKFYFIHDSFEPERIAEHRDKRLVHVALKAWTHWVFYLGPFNSILLLGLAAVVRQPVYRLALISVALVLLVDLITPWLMPHYVAPAAGFFVLLLTASARALHTHFRGKRLIRQTIAVFPLALIGIYALGQAWHVHTLPPDQWLDRWIFFREIAAAPNRDRQRIAAQLGTRDGEHLVLVPQRRPIPQSMRHNGWVNNLPPLNEQSVLWAWDLGDTKNQRLVTYYPDRHVWRLDFDAAGAARITPARLAQ